MSGGERLELRKGWRRFHRPQQKRQDTAAGLCQIASLLHSLEDFRWSIRTICFLLLCFCV